jgi:KDO2-lipid IV(A) lauroyltransferase
LFEFLRLKSLSKNKIREIVEIKGRENLDNALSKNNGVILVSAHFSNWELGAVALAEYGYEIYEVIRELSDKKVNEFVNKIKTEKNIKLIPRNNQTVKNVIKLLKENKIIILALDQNAGKGGIFINFFGKPASTFAGPIIISKRINSPIVPVFIVRKEDGNFQIIVEKEFELEKTENYSEFIFKNLQNLSNIIEDYVRKYPEQWFWFHQRWKTQP